MSATGLLQEAKRRGIILQASDGELRFRARKGSLTPELREALARHKGQILTVLQSGQPGTGNGLCPGPDRCGGCYSVGVVGGKERFLYPPQVSPDWKAWFDKWKPKGQVQ